MGESPVLVNQSIVVAQVLRENNSTTKCLQVLTCVRKLKNFSGSFGNSPANRKKSPFLAYFYSCPCSFKEFSAAVVALSGR